jgi:hypothetical protein
MIKVDIDQMAIVFKLSLATFFSKEMGQELPEGHEKAICVFPSLYLHLLRKNYNNPTRKVKILWDLLQSKQLANEVHESMIQKAYEKHRSVLTTVGSTPSPILEHLRQYARQFAEVVGKLYHNKTYLAPNKGYLGFPRSKGGCRTALKPNLVFKGGYRRLTTLTRLDPVVIHLFGPPGKGKSFICSRLIRKLSKVFGLNYDDVYQRSVATEHWDGYRGQLISQIDDVFTRSDNEDDCAQLIQICSNADVVLPMADLKDKGKKFKSEFLIMSSNAPWMAGGQLTNKNALMRRIYPAFELLSYCPKSKIYRIARHEHDGKTGTFVTENREFNLKDLIDFLLEFSLTTYRSHVQSIEILDEKPYLKLYQPIQSGNIGEYGFGYEYPLMPEDGLPTVKAQAIKEPLKVRMITKGQSENWVLKPLQKAMFEAMKEFPCFGLTSGQHINLDLLDLNQRFLLSGDYESATDNLNMDVMETVVDELLKVLPSDIHRYLIKESGIHLITYPDSSKLGPVLQKRGQLMGSLLSFPILCVANASSYGLATKTDNLVDLKAAINGDDILFCDNYRRIKSWKRIASAMGLKPSIGKNFQSETWGTVNSQLCHRNGKKWKVETTGLFNCLFRKPDGPLTVTKALEAFPKPLIVSVCKDQLKQTPQSIDISYKHGGLGLTSTRTPNETDMEIYLFKTLKKQTKVELTLDDRALVTGPRDIISTFVEVDILRDAIREGQYPPKSLQLGESTNYYDPDPITDHDQCIFDWPGFVEFRKFYKTVPALREFVKQRKFDKPINHHKLVTSWVKIEDLKDLPLHVFV